MISIQFEDRSYIMRKTFIKGELNSLCKCFNYHGANITIIRINGLFFYRQLLSNIFAQCRIGDMIFFRYPVQINVRILFPIIECRFFFLCSIFAQTNLLLCAACFKNIFSILNCTAILALSLSSSSFFKSRYIFIFLMSNIFVSSVLKYIGCFQL